MTPLEYATRCAKKYELDKWKLEELVKGRGHEPREVVDRSKPLMALLQVCRICTTRRGGVRPFAASRIVAAYRLDLLSAGLNPDGGEVRCILSRRHWLATVARVRLSGGELPAPNETIARRVAGILTRRQNQQQRELQADLCEPAADAQLTTALTNEAL